MIDVRTGIRKTYRCRVGASRLRQASGRNANQTDSEPHRLSPPVLSGPTADHGPSRGRAGWEIVGRDHLDRGSVQNEAHQEQDLLTRMAMLGRALEDPGSQRHTQSETDPSALASSWCAWEGPFRAMHHRASGKRDPHLQSWCARKRSPRPGKCGGIATEIATVSGWLSER